MEKATWINPRSKGNLGSSLAMETCISWLVRHGLGWRGTNLDDRHTAFANRYPQRVGNISLGDGVDAKGELLRVFQRAFNSTEPVYVIDSRAQADRLILDAMDSLQVLEQAKDLGVIMVFFIIPYDDDEHMRNMIDLIEFGDDHARWLIVKNPTKAPCRSFAGSGIERALLKLGAKEITLPGISSPTMLTLERHCLKLGRELPLAEAAQDNKLPALNRAEIQAFLGRSFSQLDVIAAHLLPSMQASRIKPALSKPTQTRKILDLMADYGNVETT